MQKLLIFGSNYSLYLVCNRALTYVSKFESILGNFHDFYLKLVLQFLMCDISVSKLRGVLWFSVFAALQCSTRHATLSKTLPYNAQCMHWLDCIAHSCLHKGKTKQWSKCYTEIR